MVVVVVDGGGDDADVLVVVESSVGMDATAEKGDWLLLLMCAAKRRSH